MMIEEDLLDGGVSKKRSSHLGLSRCVLFSLLFFAVTVIAVVLPVAFLALRATEAAETFAQRGSHEFASNVDDDDDDVLTAAASPGPGAVTVAFGSCSSYDEREQPVWAAVQTANPSAWVWGGDMIYFDKQLHSCAREPHTEPDCVQCAPGFNQSLVRYGCATTDRRHAVARVRAQLELTQYDQFVTFMCNSSSTTGVDYTGPDCKRPILGTWDDHDYGWNNGDKTHPFKQEFKTIFLDAIAERRNSQRRSSAHGLEHSYYLKSTTPATTPATPVTTTTTATKTDDSRQLHEGEGVHQIVLLDVRYNRDVLPCTARLDQCLFLQWTDQCQLMLGTKIRPLALAMTTGTTTTTGTTMAAAADREAVRAKFVDLLRSDQFDGQCCRADDLVLRGWCQRAESLAHPLFQEACDPFSARYGHRPLTFRLATGEPELPTSGGQENYFCDVLGFRQRRWLRSKLLEQQPPPSGAAARPRIRSRLVVSGSVVLGNPLGGTPCQTTGGGPKPPVHCNCSSDDWDCFPAAQANFIATVTESLTDDAAAAAAASVPAGTVDGAADGQKSAVAGAGAGAAVPTVVLVGDYHYGDIKVMDRGRRLPQFPGRALARPLVQIMSSGLTRSTAHALDCDQVPWVKDKFETRVGGPCNYVDQPNFGLVQVNQTHVRLTVHPVDLQSASKIEYFLNL